MPMKTVLLNWLAPSEIMLFATVMLLVPDRISTPVAIPGAVAESVVLEFERPNIRLPEIVVFVASECEIPATTVPRSPLLKFEILDITLPETNEPDPVRKRIPTADTLPFDSPTSAEFVVRFVIVLP